MRHIAWTITLLTAAMLIMLGAAPVQGAPGLQRDTATPTERPTATPTPTDTPIPPTATATNTPPLPTDTPVTPPTATFTPTAAPTKPPAKTTKPAAAPAAPAGAHLTLALTANPTAPAAGSRVTYTGHVANDGGAPAEDVVVLGDVPGEMRVLSATTAQGTATVAGNRVTIQVGTLAVGQRVAITIEAQLTDGVGAGVPMSLTMTASAAGGLSAIAAPVAVEIPAVPNTGIGLTALLLITGLILAAVVLIARGLQMRRPPVH